MTKPTRRGDSWWRRHALGRWESAAAAVAPWALASGLPPPPPPSGGVPPPPPPPRSRPPEPVTPPGPGPASEPPSSNRRNLLIAAAVILGGLLAWFLATTFVFDSEPAEDAQPVPLAACGAAPPPAPEPMQFPKEPKNTLEKGVDYWAIIKTSCGDMQVDLLERKTPRAVNNFVFLAQAGFYDGLVWHQVSPDFIIQTGDPNGVNATLPDGPGYTIKDEVPDTSRPYIFGAVGFANTGAPHTAGSQFFIVVHDLAGAMDDDPTPLRIEPTYTIFGRVQKEFYGSVNEIAQQRTMGGSDPLVATRPLVPVYLNSVEIFQRS